MRTLIVIMFLGLCSLHAADDRLDQAVHKGLKALADLQQDDGSIGAGPGITALAGMAFLSGGHTPTNGAFRQASARCLRYILAEQDPLSGYLGSDTGQMYAHGFATLYLAECYGMSPDPRVRRALEAALDLIFRCQNPEGGWRYRPAPFDADMSVTVCQIMAIRAAYNVGLGGAQAQATIGRAIDYVRKCALPTGAFKYKTNSGSWGTTGAEGIPRASAGAMCLIGSGVNSATDSVLGPALRFVRTHVTEHLEGQGSWYWYGQYYAAQAMFHSPETSDWDMYWQTASKTIMNYQGSDGLWSQPEDHGAAFGTAMALIILQIPNNYLPIFQR